MEIMAVENLVDWFVKPHSLALYHLVVIICASMAVSIAATVCCNSVLDRVSRFYAATLLVLSSAFAFNFVLFDVNHHWLAQERFYFSSLQMCFGPLLYLYTCNLTTSHHRWRMGYLLHFVPAPLLMLLWWWQLPVSQTSWLALDCWVNPNCQPLAASRTLHKWLAYTSMFGYGLLVLARLKSHQVNIRDYFSAIEDIQLRWLSVVAYCAIVSMLASISYELLSYFALVPRYSQNLLFAITPTVILLLFAFFSSHQTKPAIEQLKEELIALKTPVSNTVLTEKSPAEQELNHQHAVSASALDKPVADGSSDNDDKEPEVEGKYRTSSLTTHAAAQLWHKITQYVERDKAFLTPGLKIVDIANALEHPVHHISETINGYAGLSFYDLINRYRIVEAAKYLRHHSEKSVTEIGYDVGFNSTSTFFTHFKKHFAQTPKKYRQQALSADSGENTAIKTTD
ncbi:AraC family transcriptional regulator [Thalassotalea euphylliae]|uniref:AraC family transcriptional regulator n=1 Tax=Thalassotalea euphylliae TaxID=1655234 RepID=A0A3E0TNW7_9GAMM|nr:helix-turn-helix domain-containing protein [Thalassotalea euphylliae]REL26266.1 AraC family transcriptional regulator [Thalassotalea euphylliae]